MAWEVGNDVVITQNKDKFNYEKKEYLVKNGLKIKLSENQHNIVDFSYPCFHTQVL